MIEGGRSGCCLVSFPPCILQPACFALLLGSWDLETSTSWQSKTLPEVIMGNQSADSYGSTAASIQIVMQGQLGLVAVSCHGSCVRSSAAALISKWKSSNEDGITSLMLRKN
jgi:hypothetical protein